MRFMPRRFRKRFRGTTERLRISTILKWADAFHEWHKHWPRSTSGLIPQSQRTTWRQVENALREGFRGLRGGSSIARLLAEHRGVRNVGNLPDLTESQILRWADAFFKKHGRWPGDRGDGEIPGSSGETWRNVDAALREGGRGLRGRSSLQRLLENRRGVRNQANLPKLTVRQILRWSDEHKKRTGRFPAATVEEVIPKSNGETWKRIDNALHRGARGLPQTSLAKLLATRRNYRNVHNLPRLTTKEILAWANAHRKQCGKWPSAYSGAIHGTTETWSRINDCFRYGHRGLNSGTSLSRFLKSRGK